MLGRLAAPCCQHRTAYHSSSCVVVALLVCLPGCFHWQVGASTKPSELVDLIRTLWPNPAALPGKIVLITRLGAGAVAEKLPPLVRAVNGAGFGAPVVWTCDPMHGNTRVVAASGLKTREFDDILAGEGRGGGVCCVCGGGILGACGMMTPS